MSTLKRTNLGDLTTSDLQIYESETCEALEKWFKHHPVEKGVIVLSKKNELVAAISRYSFFTLLSSAFGRELFLNKSIEKLCKEKPEIGIDLWLQEDMEIHLAIAEALDRPLAHRYDPVVVIKKELSPSIIDIENLLWVHLRETEHLNEKLSKANRDKNEMLGIASHDLKNPLGVISTMIDVIRSDSTDEAIKKDLLERISQNIKKMVHIISTFIDASRVEGHLFNPDPMDFALKPFLEGLFSNHRIAAESKQQELSIKIQEVRSVEMFTDKNHVQCVLDNILSNAIKYTPREGTIKVSAHVKDGEILVFEVSDTGPGLSDEDQKVLFKKFSRLTPQPTGGESSTGLGLYTVRKICAGLGGKVSVDSKLGKGSTFKVQIPLNFKRDEEALATKS